MQAAATPSNEAQRIAALHALNVLDTPAEAEFAALVNAAAAVCGTPISLVSLVDMDRQWFKANRGLDGANQTPRDVAFCAHPIFQDGLIEVPDATRLRSISRHLLVRCSRDSVPVCPRPLR